MRFAQKLAALIVLHTLLSSSSPAADSAQPVKVRDTENFDANWLFLKSDAPRAEQNNFNDSAWRKLNVPHDWSIEGPFAETNQTGGAGSFLPSGIGWYRKHFSLPKDLPNRNVTLEFDGVMQNSDVWINGYHLGHRPFGYVSFSYDLTGHLNFGGDNVIAVRCDTSEQPASRWYSGAGIYRHVRLVQNTKIFIPLSGIFVSTPRVDNAVATVHVQVTVTNKAGSTQPVFLNISLVDSDQEVAASIQTPMLTISNASTGQFDEDLTVTAPRLWDLNHPLLYQAKVEVCGPPLGTDTTAAPSPRFMPWGSLDDRAEVSFGIRDARFDANNGFSLNGKNFKLFGVCLHHDGGAFGAAVPLSIWEDRLKILKTLGVNAIRTAHNPPAPEFLDLCDRIGFLVMDEMFDCWTVGKNSFDYHLYFNEWSKIDERESILRDRNHPSVILYSVGNEIHDTPQEEKARRILAGLVEVAHAADPTRPVTQALFRPNVSHDYDNGLADLLDVVGTNYRDNELLAAQRARPERKIIGTEQRHDRQTWLWLRDNPSHSGQFLWTGVDYLGESRRWPIINHSSGLLDRTGEIKPMAFERLSWWGNDPMVRIVRRTAPNDRMPADPGYGGEELHTQVQFADWTSRNTAPHDETVEAYSNCEEVELFLNGQSLGSKVINADASPRVWRVPYVAGTLKAVAKNGNITLATDELHTAGKPVKIVLSTETKMLATGWDGVAVVRAAITDANGIIAPRASDLVSFKIVGPGLVAAVDSGDTISHEPFQASQRYAFQGECVAFIKATATAGKITVTATTPGLKAGSVSFQASPELSR